MTLFDSFKRVLTAEGMPFEASEGSRAIRVATVGTNGRWFTFARLDKDTLRFFAVSPIEATEVARLAVMELVARVNHNLPIATLELDVATGGIRMRTTLDGEPLQGAPDAVIDACVRAAFWACVSAMDVYLPAILRVVNLGEPPDEALARVEAGRS